jgi:spermidine/putrescine transport system ATP-binding protein
MASRAGPLEHDVEVQGVTKTYGALTAVRDVTLQVARGEFFSILGPSGCGKTTILRMIAGFLEPSAGEILIGGRPMRGVPPHRRPTSLVFQHLALFPLMTVYDNIAFGLRMRKRPEPEIRRQVAEKLELINLPGYEAKHPHQLSGGEKQRVAIARSLVIEPTVLLLDEPLGALDLKLREHMKAELKAIQHRVRTTFIYITHDQGEALAMSDHVAVMSRGRLQQVGTPAEVYETPRTAFVAHFVGENNALVGRVAGGDGGPVAHAVVETAEGTYRARNPLGLAPGAAGLCFVRPEKLVVGPPAATPGGPSPNRLDGTVRELYYEGVIVKARVALASGRELSVTIPAVSGAVLPTVGQAVTLAFSPDEAYVLPEEEGRGGA